MYNHINEELLLEMAEIGRFNGYRIMIYGNEGPVPHFHVEHKEKGINSCIRIDKAEYFSHGKHKDKLSRDTIKELYNFLKQPHKTFGKHGYNNWQIICIYWDDNNIEFTLDDISSMSMPDYTKIK